MAEALSANGTAGDHNVLALDLATQTGWASRNDNGSITFGSFRLPKTGDNVGAYLSAFHHWLIEIVDLFDKPSLTVVFEAPILPKTTGIKVVRKLQGLAGHTEFICDQMGVKSCMEVNNKSVRKHFIGNGGAKRDDAKRMTIEQCTKRGFRPQNDDEADALAVLDYACHCLKLPGLVPGGLFTEVV